jgi:glycosyltransferase involved in cell wall biosynthesis
MHILQVHNTVIPVQKYGGIERIVCWLGKELVRLGHKVTYLVPEGSTCPFAKCLVYDESKSINEQIPKNIDFVHLHFQVEQAPHKPYLISCHTNHHSQNEYNINTVFSSRNHAERNQSETYVHNGIDIENYPSVDWGLKRQHLLFMAYAKRPEKNLKGCVDIARSTKNKLAVIGLKNKWYRRFDPLVKARGFLGGEERDQVINASSALLFPVLWHEPFGIAMLEALYFGCPVLGSPYGSLPELIHSEVGFLSAKKSELIKEAKNLDRYNRKRCHEYVCDKFTSLIMTRNYFKLYLKVLDGETLNPKPPVNGGNFDPSELLSLE